MARILPGVAEHDIATVDDVAELVRRFYQAAIDRAPVASALASPQEVH